VISTSEQNAQTDAEPEVISESEQNAQTDVGLAKGQAKPPSFHLDRLAQISNSFGESTPVHLR
jgi:hypothetical protein